MNWIERWFDVSPDGGDGTLELLYIAVGVLVVASIAGHRWLRHRLARLLLSRT